jgi:signal transduction histidine kinase
MDGDNGDVTWTGALADRVAAEWPAAAAVGLGAAAAGQAALRNDGTALSLALVLAVAATAPLVLVRTQVVAAAGAVVGAAATGLAVDGRMPVAAVAAVAIVLHELGRHRPWRAAALMAAALAVLAAVNPSDRSGDGVGAGPRASATVLALVAVGAAAVGAGRRWRAEAATRRAAERTIADTLMDHVARGERARIARELHDVVAHHISMIAVQAETARLTTPGMPTEGAERLLAIGDTARAALTEMRRLLGVLREDAQPVPSRSPQPGLEQLVELVDQARASGGASTRLIVRGCVEPLDPGVELTAFRLVQEALTNARRHAPGAAVDVELSYTPDALHVLVRDNGPGPVPSASPRARSTGATGAALADAAPAGHGLVGMRERAATLGGTLRTGPAPTRGFLVEATLPVGGR